MEEARAALVKAADDMAQFYDAHRCEAPKYNVGDKVWLSSENHRTVHPTKKLDYKWLGPYVVKRVISCSAYQLKLPASFGKPTPSSQSLSYVPSRVTQFLNTRNATHCHHPRLFATGSKSTKSKRSLTARYSMERLST